MDRFAESAQARLKLFEKSALAFAAVGGAIAAGFGAAAKAFGEFEGVMNGVQSVSGATAGELRQLSAMALQLGADTQFSAKEAATAFYELAKAGFSVEQQMAAVKGVMDLAAAGQLGVGEAAEISAGILRGFGKDAGDAAAVADQLAQAANSSAVDVTDIAEAMKYVAPIAKSSGQGLEEMTAALAALGDQQIKGSQAGTTLRSALVALIKPEGDSAKLLHALGISVQDTHGKMLPLRDILDQLREKLAKKTEVEKNAALAQIFGQEAVSGMLALLNLTPAAYDRYEQAQRKATGVAASMADGLNRGLNFQVKQLIGSMETLAIKIGGDLAPVLGRIVESVTGLVNAFMGLPAPLRTGIELAAGFAAAVAGVSALLGGLAAVLPAIAAGFAALTGPVGLTVMAVVGVTMAVGAAAVAFQRLQEAQRPAIRQLEGQRNTLQALVSQYEALNAKTNRTKEQEKQRLALLEKIRDISPDLVTAIDDQGRAHELNAPKVRQYYDELARGMRLELERLQQQQVTAGHAMAEVKVRLREEVKRLDDLQNQARVEAQPVNVPGGKGGLTRDTELRLSAQRQLVDSLRDEFTTREKLYAEAKRAVDATKELVAGPKREPPPGKRSPGTGVRPPEGAGDKALQEAKQKIDEVKRKFADREFQGTLDQQFQAALGRLGAFYKKSGQIGQAAEAAIADVVQQYANRRIKATEDEAKRRQLNLQGQIALFRALEKEPAFQGGGPGRAAARAAIEQKATDLTNQSLDEQRTAHRKAVDDREKAEQEAIRQRIASERKAAEALLALDGEFGAEREAAVRAHAQAVEEDQAELLGRQIAAIDRNLGEIQEKYGGNSAAYKEAARAAATEVANILSEAAAAEEARAQETEQGITEAKLRGLEARRDLLEEDLDQTLEAENLSGRQRRSRANELMRQLLAADQRAQEVKVGLLRRAHKQIETDERLDANVRKELAAALQAQIADIEQRGGKRRQDLARDTSKQLIEIDKDTQARQRQAIDQVGEDLAVGLDIVLTSIRSLWQAQKADSPAQIAEALLPAAEALLSLAGPWGMMAAGILDLVVELWSAAEQESLEAAKKAAERITEDLARVRSSFDRAVADMMDAQKLRRELVDLTTPDPGQRARKLDELAAQDLGFWQDLYGRIGGLEQEALARLTSEEKAALAKVADKSERLELEKKFEQQRTEIHNYWLGKRLDAEKGMLAAVKALRDELFKEAQPELQRTFLARVAKAEVAAKDTDETLEARKRSVRARGELGIGGMTEEAANREIVKLTEQQAALIMRALEKPGVSPEDRAKLEERLVELGRQNAKAIQDNAAKAATAKDALGQLADAIGKENGALPRLLALAAQADAAAAALGEIAKQTGAPSAAAASDKAKLPAPPPALAPPPTPPPAPPPAPLKEIQPEFRPTSGVGLLNQLSPLPAGGGWGTTPGSLVANNSASFGGDRFHEGGLVEGDGSEAPGWWPVFSFDTGGRVPGDGDSDTVAAWLTPGEVVVPRNLVGALSRAVQAMHGLVAAPSANRSLALSVNFTGPLQVRSDEDIPRLANEVLRLAARELRAQFV